MVAPARIFNWPHVRRSVPQASRLLMVVATLATVLLAAPAFAAWGGNAPPAAAAKKVKSLEKRVGCGARFVTSMLVGPRGGLWVGDEMSGIWHRRAGSNTWRNFSTSNSPGLVSNRIYSLCIDHQGILFAGTLRRGVCACNGKKWEHLGILSGPIGSHIVAIANDPVGDSVWFCSENGISIFSTRKHTWRYISPMNGLPANPDCVAFNAKGTAFVGSLCGGLGISPYPYKHWRVIQAPWRMPRTPYGSGLPSNLINCLLVGRTGTLYVGTDLGLAISHNNGESFRYERGRDYAAKVLGLWHPPMDFSMPVKTLLNKLLPGDHITCLAQGPAGNLYVGTWRDCYAKINTRTGEILQSRLTPGLSQLDGYITELAPLADGTLAIGRYGFGVSTLKLPPEKLAKSRDSRRHVPAIRPRIARPLVGSPLPVAAKPPSQQQLRGLNKVLKRLATVSHRASFLGADWATEGDWVGRYGRQYTRLFATVSPFSQTITTDTKNLYRVVAGIGPHVLPGHIPAAAAWISWMHSRDHRTLWDPIQGTRRQAEFDDRGESYPTTFDGPDLWMSLRVPAGVFRLALYFMNKDGHFGFNRQRDYLVSLYPHAGSFATLARMRPLARARVVNFWYGVYESFAVTGPTDYMLRIKRGSSLNTIVSAVLIGRLSGPRENHWTGWRHAAFPLPWMGRVSYGPPACGTVSTNSRVGGLAQLWKDAGARRLGTGCGFAAAARLLIYRAAVSAHAPHWLLARWRWRIPVWTRTSRVKFEKTIHAAWKSEKKCMTVTPFRKN